MTKDIYVDFLKATANHKVEVLLDKGVHRSLLFKDQSGSYMYGFELNTWPGHLAITGDISDGLIFTRLYDMFEFFRSDRNYDDIDFRYWAEKLTTGRQSVREFSEKLARESVLRDVHQWLEYADLGESDTEQLFEEVDELFGYADASTLIERIYNYTFIDSDRNTHHVFQDVEPHDWSEFNYRFYLNCYAIQAGIKAYNRYKSGGEGTWLHQESLLQAHGITRTSSDSV